MHYSEFVIQPYLIISDLSLPEKKLLLSLRSKCYPAKMNFKKLNKGSLMCSFLCQSEETQKHIFEQCRPIQSRISYPVNVNLDDIYGGIDDQVRTIKILIKIDHIRRSMKEDILPGGFMARTHVNI